MELGFADTYSMGLIIMGSQAFVNQLGDCGWMWQSASYCYLLPCTAVSGLPPQSLLCQVKNPIHRIRLFLSSPGSPVSFSFINCSFLGTSHFSDSLVKLKRKSFVAFVSHIWLCVGIFFFIFLFFHLQFSFWCYHALIDTYIVSDKSICQMSKRPCRCSSRDLRGWSESRCVPATGLLPGKGVMPPLAPVSSITPVAFMAPRPAEFMCRSNS